MPNITVADPKPQLKHAVLSTMLGQGFFGACQWAMLIVLAKVGSAASVGEYALALAVTAPIQLFCDLALRTIQATDSGRRYDFRDYLGLRLLTSLCSLIAILALVSLAHYQTDTRSVIVVVGLLKCLESVGDIFYGLFQQLEKMHLVSASLALRGMLYLGALYCGLVTSGRLFAACSLLVAARALVILVHDAPHAIRLRRIEGGAGTSILPRWRRPSMRALLLDGLPSGAAVGVMSFNTNVPRYALQYYAGASLLGIFAAYSNLILAMSLLIDAIGQAICPRLAIYYQAADYSQFRRLLGLVVCIALVIATLQLVLIAVLGTEIVTRVYKADFAAYPGSFDALAFAALFLYSNAIFGYALFAVGAFRGVLAGQLISSVVVIAASLTFVPRLGMAGAAIALIGSAMTCSAAYLINLRRKVGSPLSVPSPRLIFDSLAQLLGRDSIRP